MEMTETEPGAPKRHVWNAGRTVGAKRALKPKQIWEIRFYLNQRRRLRDRALFDLAIDSKLRGCDLVQMKIGDLVSGGQIRTRAIVIEVAPLNDLTGPRSYIRVRQMTDITTRRYNDGEVLSGVQRRRRWTPEEKVRIVEETYLPGMSVSLVARQHGISGSQVFTWRRLMNQGALTAAAAGEEVVPASEYRALEAQVRELHRLLGKKAMENELSARPCPGPQAPKKLLLRSTSLPRDGR